MCLHPNPWLGTYSHANASGFGCSTSSALVVLEHECSLDVVGESTYTCSSPNMDFKSENTRSQEAEFGLIANTTRPYPGRG